MPWRGQRAPPATRGCLFRFGEREGKALGVPARAKGQRRSGAQRKEHRITKTAPSHGAMQTDDVPASRVRDQAVAQSAAPPLKRARVRRSSGKERRESASGSAQRRRALRSAQRGTERVRKPSRSSSPAPDRHPDGPGLLARFAPADRAGRPKGSAATWVTQVDQSKAAIAIFWVREGVATWVPKDLLPILPGWFDLIVWNPRIPVVAVFVAIH